jgi:hypothetical protein
MEGTAGLGGDNTLVRPTLGDPEAIEETIGVLFARKGARITLSKSLLSPRLEPPTRPGTGSFAGGLGTGLGPGGDAEYAAVATSGDVAGGAAGARNFLYWYLFRMNFSISLSRSDSSKSVGGGCRRSSGL